MKRYVLIVLLLCAGGLVLYYSTIAKRARSTAESTQPLVDPDTDLNRKLVAAVLKNDVANLKALLDQGASADTRVHYGRLPGMMPVAHLTTKPRELQTPANRQTFDALIDRVRNVDAAGDADGMTLLMMAAYLDDLPAVKHLVDAGAKVEARRHMIPHTMVGNDTALSVAVDASVGRSGSNVVPVVDCLLDHGADVDVQDAGGMSPLMTACQFGDVELAKELLSRKANPALLDAHGHNALWYASTGKRREIVEMLKGRK